MIVRKTDVFIAAVERQFQWYLTHAPWEVADRYLDAVEAASRLLGRHPRLGPPGDFTHPRLSDWRFFVVARPFHKHVLFYEIAGDDIVMRRAMHGHRDLPRRLIESPWTD